MGLLILEQAYPEKIPEIPFPEPRILCSSDLSMPYFSGGNNVLFSTTLSKDPHSTRSSCHVLRTAIQWFPELFSCGIFRNFLFLFSSVWFGSFRLGQFSSVQFRSGQVRSGQVRSGHVTFVYKSLFNFSVFKRKFLKILILNFALIKNISSKKRQNSRLHWEVEVFR